MEIKARRTTARGDVAEEVTITARAVPPEAPRMVLLDITGTKVAKHYDIALGDFREMALEILGEDPGIMTAIDAAADAMIKRRGL